MKYTGALTLGLVASTAAFAPSSSNGRVSTARDALADRIFGMDLFDKENNKYGAREKKEKTKLGSLGSNSYIPAGLTKEQYEKIRAQEAAKKAENYKKNVAKAFKYTDFTEWYAKRGTELAQGWKKSVTLGHTMAKTKYDWSGVEDAKKFESTKGSIFGSSNKPAPAKAAAKPSAKAAAKPAAKKGKWFY